MSVLTRRGRLFNSLRPFGLVDYEIDAAAVGTGTAPESIDDTALQNERYRTKIENEDLSFQPYQQNPYYIQPVLNIGGGREVPADTRITEFGLFADGRKDEYGEVTGRNILVFRAVYGGTEINAGFEVPFWIFYGLPHFPVGVDRQAELNNAAAAYEAVTGQPFPSEDPAINTLGGPDL